MYHILLSLEYRNHVVTYITFAISANEITFKKRFHDKWNIKLGSEKNQIKHTYMTDNSLKKGG